MRKIIRHFLPSPDVIHRQRWLKPFASFLAHHNLWYLHRRSVSGGVAIGMFCGLLPAPFQMMSATITAIIFRVNLPVAVLTTVYTNPFTIVPLYLLAYQIGAWVLQIDSSQLMHMPVFPEFTLNNGWHVLLDWFVALGKPLVLGTLILASVLAFMGYILVRLAWRIWVVYRWHKRKSNRVH